MKKRDEWKQLLTELKAMTPEIDSKKIVNTAIIQAPVQKEKQPVFQWNKQKWLVSLSFSIVVILLFSFFIPPLIQDRSEPESVYATKKEEVYGVAMISLASLIESHQSLFAEDTDYLEDIDDEKITYLHYHLSTIRLFLGSDISNRFSSTLSDKSLYDKKITYASVTVLNEPVVFELYYQEDTINELVYGLIVYNEQEIEVIGLIENSVTQKKITFVYEILGQGNDDFIQVVASQANESVSFAYEITKNFQIVYQTTVGYYSQNGMAYALLQVPSSPIFTNQYLIYDGEKKSEVQIEYSAYSINLDQEAPDTNTEEGSISVEYSRNEDQITSFFSANIQGTSSTYAIEQNK